MSKPNLVDALPDAVTGASRTDGWKMQTYLVGVLGGLVLGALSAYMYNRAAEEEVRRTGTPPSPQTGELMGLVLALLATVRQIAEMGRPDQKRRK
jgi:nitrate reductase gamma subunit